MRDDNDRLKKIINNNSDNSSKPPSTDIKKNIPNNREKSNKSKCGQKGHKGSGLKKAEIVKKIKNKEIEHEIINLGKPQGEFVSKYIIDIEVKTIAREYRLLNRLSKYKENHIKFLKDFTVPFDNNLSERDLRNVKIKQKISGYFGNLEKAKNFFNIKSIIMTLKRQGKDFYSEIYKKYKKNPITA